MRSGSVIRMTSLNSEVPAAEANDRHAFASTREPPIGDAVFGAGDPSQEWRGQYGAEEFPAGKIVRLAFGIGEAVDGGFLPVGVPGRRPPQKAQEVLRQERRTGCGDAAQLLQNRGASTRIGLPVVEQLVRPMRAHGNAMDFVYEAGRVHRGADVAGFLRLLHGPGEDINPLTHDRGDAIADHAALTVKLKRSGAEETAAAKSAFLHQHQPLIDQAPETRQAPWRSDGRARHFVDKDLAGHFNGSQLQVFLRTKVGKEAAFAHAQLRGERANGEAFEPIHRGNIDGAGKDGFAGANSAGLTAGSRLLARGADG